MCEFCELCFEFQLGGFEDVGGGEVRGVVFFLGVPVVGFVGFLGIRFVVAEQRYAFF